MEYKIKCRKCSRYLGSTTKSLEVTLKCSNSSCKSLEEYKITFMSDLEHDHPHTTKNTEEKIE